MEDDSFRLGRYVLTALTQTQAVVSAPIDLGGVKALIPKLRRMLSLGIGPMLLKAITIWRGFFKILLEIQSLA